MRINKFIGKTANLERLTVLFYPAFESASAKEFTDHYYRMIWYLNPLLYKINKVILPYKGPTPSLGPVPYYLDPSIKAIEDNFNYVVDFVGVENDKDFIDVANESNLVLLWRMTSGKGDWFPDSPVKEIVKKKKVYRIDHHNERHAGSFYLKVSAELGLDEDAIVKECQEKFYSIPAKYFKSIGYIFGTGPSLKAAMDWDFSNGTPLACNSMVKNTPLMRKLQPPIIVIADPIFHAGCSSYAGEFRKHLYEAMKEFNSYLIVPMRDYRIYIANMDSSLTERIIGIPMRPGKQPNLNLYQNYYVTTTSNILTLFLIPLAATFFGKVYIMGCDGRPLDQNDYFWRHDPSSQLTEHMSDIQVAHPAFFEIDYNDYYLEHCKVLERWLDAAEKQGKYFGNLTPSYIPALQARQESNENFNENNRQKRPVVSIIMPAFNEAEVIRNSIESVQSQSFKNWELLVIDDGSTDNTFEVVHSFISKDTRVRFLRNKGKGVSSARNTGLDFARGEFITFLDADDCYFSGALERRVEALKHHLDWNVVYCITEIVNERFEKLDWQLGRQKKVSFKDMSGNPVHIISIMGRAELFRKVRFQSGLTNGEDWLFIAQVLRSGEVFHRVDGCKVAYRLHRGSTVTNDFLRHENQLLKVLDKIYSPHEGNLPVAPEYAQGLSTPPKQTVILRRRVGLLTWLLLAQRPEETASVVDELRYQDLSVLSKQDIRNQIKFPTMRFYICNRNEFKNYLRRDAKRLFKQIKQVELEKVFPRYVKEFQHYVENAERNKIKFSKTENTSTKGSLPVDSKPKFYHIYQVIAVYLKRHHPTLARVARFVLWCLRKIRRKPLGTSGLLAILIIGLLGSATVSDQYRWLLAGGGVGLFVLLIAGLGIGYGEFLFNKYVQDQRRKLHEVDERGKHNISKKISKLNGKINSLVETEIEKVEDYVWDVDNKLKREIVTIQGNLNNIKKNISELEGDVRHNLDQLDNRINNIGKEMSKLEGEVKDNLSYLDDRIKEVVPCIQEFSNSSLCQTSNKLEEKLTEVLTTIEHLRDQIIQTQKSNINNFRLYQRFNRQLNDEDINYLLKVWLPKLGLKMDKKALGYLAHKICLAEDMCVGRLASSIEAALLRVLISRSVQDRNLDVLEIGTLFGIGVAAIHECCRGVFENMHLTVIDPLDGYYGRNNYDVLTQMPVTLNTFVLNMQRMNIPEEQFIIIPELSTQDTAVERASERQYNVLIIDSDHSWFGVKHDFYNYKGMVKRGGYIIFDDYDTTDWPDVKTFVDKEVIGRPELEFIGADWRTAVFRVITSKKIIS